MKYVKKFTGYMIFIILMWSIVCIIRPFWDRYWLKKEMEIAALYGTKNSIEQARGILGRKMTEKGYNFEGDDFFIEKDEDNMVSINIAYIDEITVFGVSLKQFEFILETTASEVKAYY